jgi:hypothetical protein
MNRFRFPRSQAYIKSNPRFALTTLARPKLQRGQMTIVLESLEASKLNGLRLEEIVAECQLRNYELTFRNPANDIRKSIIYHLDRIESVRQVAS